MNLTDHEKAVIAGARRARDKQEQLSNAVQQHKADYLKTRGWRETCMTPGSYWLWTKRIEHTWHSRGAKRTETYDALCDIDMAFTIQLAQDL